MAGDFCCGASMQLETIIKSIGNLVRCFSGSRRLEFARLIIQRVAYRDLLPLATQRALTDPRPQNGACLIKRATSRFTVSWFGGALGVIVSLHSAFAVTQEEIIAKCRGTVRPLVQACLHRKGGGDHWANLEACRESVGVRSIVRACVVRLSGSSDIKHCGVGAGAKGHPRCHF